MANKCLYYLECVHYFFLRGWLFLIKSVQVKGEIDASEFLD